MTINNNGQDVSITNHRSNFIVVGSDEPHATRRKVILAAHPEITNLMKIDTTFKWKVLAIVFLDLLLYYSISGITNWLILFLISYIVFGTINHTLVLAAHEVSHGQACGHDSPKLTLLMSIITTLPTGVAFSLPFKRFHLLHHRYQGDVDIDYDLPTEWEAKFFNNRFKKFIFLLLQGFIYSLRPLILAPIKVVPIELLAWAVQIVFNYMIYSILGLNVLIVMISGSFLGSGVHPASGHFISEHYVSDELMTKRKLLQISGNNDKSLDPKNPKNFDLIPETQSYYGPMNYLQFNVGHHVEHHDFPSVPGSKLSEIRKIAPEFYDHLPYHTSQIQVLYNFVMDDNFGIFNRVKRNIHNKNN